MREEGQTKLTVRTVAARAGVGVGTLRHHFPTQRILFDAVLTFVYETAMPDDRIYDKTIPAPERLLDNLRRMLAPVGINQDAQNFWGNLFQAFISPTASAEMRATYPLLNEQASRRVEAWLAVLVEEGTLAPGDNTGRARFLLTVVNGLAVQRALPSDLPVLEVEAAVLATTIDTLPFRE